MKANETKEPLVVEKVLDAAPARVWSAISDRDEMAKWYFQIKELKLEPGFKFSFYGMEKEKKFLTSCRVLEVVTGSKLSYTWSFDEHPYDTVVTFELFPDGDKTRLRLTHEGQANIPSEDKDYARDSFKGGWEQFLNKLLPEYLAKG
ncbi:MAG: SRPBCC domain-containing protein [Taibaiella sp.]|nr:SRPBCC domain-containing protein [Taibaiella sp.]